MKTSFGLVWHWEFTAASALLISPLSSEHHSGFQKLHIASAACRISETISDARNFLELKTLKVIGTLQMGVWGATEQRTGLRNDRVSVLGAHLNSGEGVPTMCVLKPQVQTRSGQGS